MVRDAEWRQEPSTRDDVTGVKLEARRSRCAFVGTDGRCRETGQLEFHHVVPFARGGPTSAANLQLRCRAHSAFEAAQEFGAWRRRRRVPALWPELGPDRVGARLRPAGRAPRARV
jgi:hypothetical protein